MATVSFILSLVGAVIVLLSFVPSLGFFEWIGGIIALAGVVLGIIGLGGEKKTLSIVGIIVSAVFLILAVLRLIGLF